MESDIPEFSRPDHGFLVGWADQGVLLLNAVLTVRKGEANAHKDKVGSLKTPKWLMADKILILVEHIPVDGLSIFVNLTVRVFDDIELKIRRKKSTINSV